jgi:hypothetical protein
MVNLSIQTLTRSAIQPRAIVTMAATEFITFVIPVNDNGVYQKNFLASPLFKNKHHHEILRMSNFPSASKAYNAGIDQAGNDLIVFAHQDVFLPESWIADLRRALLNLEEQDPQWGVLGCYGVTVDDERLGFIYSTGLGILGKPFANPKPIQTLDELVLILRKSSGLRFDETLPNFHFYGTDICMQARERNRESYVISGFVIHNTNQIIRMEKAFYDCYKHVKKRWKKYLPIQTTCIRISRFNSQVFDMKFREIYQGISGRAKEQCFRAKDPREIYERLLMERKLEP